ncbi:MAG: hypothetical protein ACO36I_09295 [Candidatus Latescibacterota bacterium]
MSTVLEGLTCRPLWVSQMGCLKGCLDYLEMGMSEAWLFGVTGHAFVNNIAFDVCPSGPTAWQCNRIFELGKNAGFDVETVFACKENGDFAERQLKAWTFVREALDAGVPCYGWELQKPEYYAILGYDDTGYRFHGHGADVETPARAWNTLGNTDIGVLTVHSVKPGRAVEDDVAVCEALAFAVQFGRSRQWVFENYTSGPDGFLVWAKALETGQANGIGVAYNAVIWAECRKYAVEFLKLVVSRGILSRDEVQEAREAYEVSHHALREIAELFPFFGHDASQVQDKTRVQKAVTFLHQIHDAEDRALNTFEEIVSSEIVIHS